MTTSPTANPDTAIATRVSVLVHDLSMLRHQQDAEAARREAAAMVRAGLLHLQVGFTRLEVRQFLLEEIEVVVRREQGPSRRGEGA